MTKSTLSGLVVIYALSAIASLAVAADPQPAPTNTGSINFTFISSSGAQTQHQCLPQGQKLVKISKVTTLSSNAPSLIDLRPDITENCIDATATVQPITSCYEVPEVKFLYFKMAKRCIQVQNQLIFSVEYIFTSANN
jgi:hypothetical protein